ncbi:hypothetical protein STAS_26939 [Striga asiatica]|uniref:Uncharacterized protein n=1 Tax=Striga asiatica TaxID=4170 RepID=A0A5A7QXE0_STRAF|nr:hypothetical protein STAS_26939 [Striga asiatica]
MRCLVKIEVCQHTAAPQSTTTTRRLRPHPAPPTSSSDPATCRRSPSLPHPPSLPSVNHLSSATKSSAAEQEMLSKTTKTWPPMNTCCSGVRPLALWSPASSAIRAMRWLLKLRWSMMVAL